MPSRKFVHRHRITYSSCTVGNHVYYARYLDLLEEARGEFFRELGEPLLKLHAEGVEFPVRECRIRYEAPARYDEVLAIELWLTHLDRLWVKFGFAIRNDKGELIAEGQTDHVCVDSDQKPKRMGRPLLDLLGTYAPTDKD